ncbi:SH3-domain GRB2-like 1a [Electrophorus electricus]|uniref:SH3-domain GRB2-like 1a n=1 Tax=Electrophorus electricus TaxID=8005 RepID=UPI000F0A2B1B|nr:SH3-domain GRB2-like 1a [Electrophorus electricus]
MSVAGLKKQFYKASQMVSEKVGGAEGTKLDEDFKDLERKADITSKAIVEVLSRTSEYLQPNPASRAKLSMLSTVSKIRGQVKSTGYPQAEGLLGESMVRYGREMGEDTNFGGALVEVGESMKRLAEVKDSLDIDVKQNFIDPFQTIVDKDLRDIQHQLKKLEGRRLDYDYKKKRQGKIPDEELRASLEKFHESKEAAEMSMHNLLETDVEQVSQLFALVESQLQYHKQAVDVLEELSNQMRQRLDNAQSQPRQKRMPKRLPSFDSWDPEPPNEGFSPMAVAPASAAPPLPNRTSLRQKCRSTDQPCCKAQYDFEPENEGELGFREGDVITLTSQIDENWYEGVLRGQTGYFPCSYVEVMVPLPH